MRRVSARSSLLRKWYAQLQPGTTQVVATRYDGQKEVSAPAAKQTGVARSHPMWKCLYCPAFQTGDVRRLARHFLPQNLPEGFFDAGDYRGVKSCAGATDEMRKELAKAGSAEFKKWEAWQSGQDISGLSSMRREAPVTREDLKRKREEQAYGTLNFISW